jgi:signal peptidase II
MRKKYLLLICIAGALVVFDQLTKLYVHTRFALSESAMVIPGFFDITYVRNPGAAFGFLAQSHPQFREWFFLLLPPIAMGVIVYVLRGVSSSDRMQTLGLSMVFGGALGNYIDRVRFRYVIDFIDLHYDNVYHWPAFNVADMAIVAGIAILLMLTLFQQTPQESK